MREVRKIIARLRMGTLTQKIYVMMGMCIKH